MIRRLAQMHTRGNHRYDLLRVAIAATVALTSASIAQNVPYHAQNVPYQSSQRTAYGEGLGQVELPPGLLFEPRVEAAVQYADNITLTSNESDQVNTAGIEFAPGFYTGYRSQNLTGAIDYSLIGRLWDDGSFDDITHRLAANGRWIAIAELFYVDATASYDDTVIDAGSGLNYGGLGIFDQGNLAEQATASISPSLRKRFKDFEVAASYRYGRVWYLDVGKGDEPASIFVPLYNDDSQDQRASVSMRTVSEGSRLNGEIFYTWDHSEFERAQPYEFERAGFSGDFVLSRTLSAVGAIGRESELDESTSAGGLDSDFWDAGLKWSPHTRTSAEARYGERFFGTSYSADIRHTARLLEFTASYEETPQVETRGVSLGEFAPGELPPFLDPSAGSGVLTSSPYVSKYSQAGLTARGLRTTLALRGFDTERNYLSEFLGDEEGTGVEFTATRTLAENASLDFSATYTDYERGTTLVGPDTRSATHDYDTQFVLRGNRGFGPRLTASVETGYLTRSGDQAYDAWWVGLRGRWIPTIR
jgi:hypothetical protein